MAIKFSKMHGLGNDFMVIDLVSQSLPNSIANNSTTDAAFQLPESLIKSWSHRRFGIGFDQLLLVEPPVKPDSDFRYRIFNADGNEVEQCGNGARCFAKFVVDNQLTPKQHIHVETANGDIILEVKSNGDVAVDMGPPKLTPADLPFAAEKSALTYPLDVDGQTVEISTISMGNPHAVVIVEDIDNAPVTSMGPKIESHSSFPKRVNAGFMQIHSPSEVSVRVYERGAGETFACGTGACAAMVAGRLRGLLDEQVTVHLRGGDLNISWRNDVATDINQQSTESVLMTGPATHVFDGEIDYDG